MRLADGSQVFTHGADTAADHGTSIGPGDPERAPVCATDSSALHVIYGRPASVPERADARPQILAAVRRMNALLNEDALASGEVTADYEVVCNRAGAIVIDTFTNSGSGSFTDVVAALQRSKIRLRRGADNLIFYDGAGAQPVCGLGTIWDDERLTADNLNNVRDSYAVVYAGCWDGRTPMHENGHNQGAVQIGAPNSTGTGYHCAEAFDVMCYTPDGGDRNQLLTLLLCPQAIRYDCGHDTYFDARPEPGEYLATHWNVGSRLNSHIRFGD